MKKCLIALSSVLLLPANIVNGCGFSLMPEEYRVYLLQPGVSGSRELTDFFYTPDYFYEQGGADAAAPMKEVNAREWQVHTGYKGSWKEIEALMYDVPADQFLKYQDSLTASRAFLKYLQKRHPQELAYFAYARKCELMISNTDPWKLQQYEDTALVQACLREGQALYQKAHNDFLKLRISYQLLKLSYYHPGYGESPQHIYEAQIRDLPLASWLKASAKFYTLEQAGHSKEAYQYALSCSFDESIDKRFRCVQLFDRRQMKKVLLLARNGHEKAVLLLMGELQNPGRSLPVIKKIYELDPSNKDLAFLVTREINKLEDWLLTPELTGQGMSVESNLWDDKDRDAFLKNRLSDKAYVSDMYAFVKRAAVDKQQKEQAVWQVLASHLCILQHDKERAKLHLAEAEKLPATEKVAFQVKLNSLVLNFDGKTGMSPALEQQVLAFADYHQKHPDVFLNQDVMVNQLYLFIGKRLVHAGDVAKGIFFLSKTNRVLGTISYWTYKNYYIELLEHALPKHYDEMLAIIQKKNKAPFEAFMTDRRVAPYFVYDDIVDGYGVEDTVRVLESKVLDYKSMYYVQHNQLDSALACVSQIPASYWNSEPYGLFRCFPFKVSGGLETNSNNDFCVYDKRQFLQRMCDLKTLIATNTGDVAKHYFVLATGYFNMSNHGNYWIMNMPYKLSEEVSDNFYELDVKNEPFIDHYYGCRLAQDNYLKAMHLARDTAFAALCAARASACNIFMQEISWRKTARFNDKSYDWNKPFVPKYGVFAHDFEKRFGLKDYYEDFVSNCYHYEHLNARYF